MSFAHDLIMRRRYVPTIAELQAFEACARLGATSRAARELHLTQSAISRAINGLEKRLGVMLFHRVRQRLVLSDAGRALAAEAATLLRAINEAAMTVMAFGGHEDVLRLAVLPTLGANWLAPLLADFRDAAPFVTLDVTTRLFAVNFEHEPLDLSIVRAPAGTVGPGCEFLMPERLVMVAAPSLINDHDTLPDQALSHLPLLQQSTRPELWLDWFRDADIDPRDILRGPRFEQFGMVIEAARAGLGVALVPELLLGPALADHSLCIAAQRSLVTDTPYVLSYPERSVERRSFRAFRDWLLAITDEEPKTTGHGSQSTA